MKFMVSAGEAVVAKTASEFSRLLRQHGLPHKAIRPAFGMSECASGITWSDGSWLDTTSDTTQHVELGRAIPEARLRIVDENDRLVPEGTVGRLELSGPTVTRGYFRNDEANREAFTSDGWFRTGDLGMIRDQRLFITGREKDIVIVNGVHYASHSIETAVEELAGVATSYTAVCAVRMPGSDTEQLAVFFSPLNHDAGNVQEVTRQVRRRVLERVGVNPNLVIALRTEAVPKTAIGKIRKSELKQRLAAGGSFRKVG